MTPSRDGAAPPPGARVRCLMSKWGDRPHYEFEGRALGADGHGVWLGFLAGTIFRRPGAEFVAPVDQVTCVPWTDAERRVGHLATFHADGGPVRVYVDITGPPRWQSLGGRNGDVSWELRAVDLDLDVVADVAGRVRLDDEDEFEEHRRLFGYPAGLVDACRLEAGAVVAALGGGIAPFDGVALTWLAELTRLDDARGDAPPG